MLPDYAVLFSLPISIFFTSKYIYSAYKDKIQPNIVSWIVWSVASLLSFASSFLSGTNFLQIFSTFTAGFFPFLTVIVLIIIHKGRFKLSKLDLVCFVLAILGLVLWKTLDNPIYAYIAGILADMFGFFPTIFKTLKEPKSEDYKIYLIGVANVILQLLVIQKFELLTLGFPLYIFVFNSLEVFLILRNKN